jgi:hypothetical protein
MNSIHPTHFGCVFGRSEIAPLEGPDVFQQPESHTFSIYENELPGFVETEMTRLYANIHSSVPKLRADGCADSVTTYVLRKGAIVTAVLVFRWCGNRVEVVNECIKLDDNDIQCFADAIFSTYRSAEVISFYAVEAAVKRISYPYQCFTCLEDIVLKLPASSDAYFNSLGKSTRQNISYYSKLVRRHHASYEFRICGVQELTDALVRNIIHFSNARIAAKNQVSLHDEENTRKLAQLIRLHGFVGVVLIDGRVCAGAICSKLGSNYFLHVLAHDQLYDRYSLGTLCCYLTIRESIANGGQTFHFLWGRMEYKYRLQGVQCDLQRVVVYRSRLQLILNAALAMKTLINGVGRLIKIWLLAPERKDCVVSIAAVKIESSTRRFLSALSYRPGR